jgi:ribosomal protein S18 acetylase RimI-like enzyme
VERIAEQPTERPVVIGSFADERRRAKIGLLESLGYEPTRWFFEMLRPSLDEVEIPPLPNGIEIRPLSSAREDVRRVFDADVEAFKDHWGGFAGDEAFYQEWIHDPSFDPSLYLVAFDGDEIAGGVENAIYRAENEAFGRSRGWLDSVFTRRPWRRRGLGAALVARSLVRLREAGMTEAMLGVDSENPTGALGLYERAGFRVHTRSVAYRKPM